MKTGQRSIVFVVAVYLNGRHFHIDKNVKKTEAYINLVCIAQKATKSVQKDWAYKDRQNQWNFKIKKLLIFNNLKVSCNL